MFHNWFRWNHQPRLLLGYCYLRFCLVAFHFRNKGLVPIFKKILIRFSVCYSPTLQTVQSWKKVASDVFKTYLSLLSRFCSWPNKNIFILVNYSYHFIAMEPLEGSDYGNYNWLWEIVGKEWQEKKKNKKPSAGFDLVTSWSWCESSTAALQPLLIKELIILDFE